MFFKKLILVTLVNFLFFFFLSENNVEFWLILYFLCFSLAAVSYLNISFLGKKGFFFINFFYLGFLSLLSNYVFVVFSESLMFLHLEIFSIFFFEDNSLITLSFYLDFYNFSFINLTLTIGWAAFCYAYGYMRDELFIERFLFLLLTFLYSMIFLLIANNFVVLLIGWEMIGISSYFLINFWVSKISTFKSAFKAFIFNRLSDICIIVLMIIYLNFFNTITLVNDSWLINHKLFIFYEISGLYINGYDLMSIFCLISASCKSAQFGFHVWLPDSMEAPVPASALIHSATLVSAGIYLLNKVWFIILLSYHVYYLFVFFSSWTSLYGAFVSLYQSDLKKILAYSTISHCGILMFLSVFNNLHVLIFYLYIHGFFKSLSFMCVGNIIKTSQNIQDFRYMGQKYFNHRYEYYFLIFSLSNLSGYGLSMGFFAKHYICMNFFFLNPCLYFNFFFFVMTALCGFFYSFNLINFVFFSFYKGYSQVIIKGSSCTHTSPAGQVLVISVLNIQSLFILIYLSSFIYCSKFYELKFNFFLNFSSLDSIFFIDKSNFVKLLSLIMWVLFGIFLKTIFYRNFIYLFNFVFMYIFALIF